MKGIILSCLLVLNSTCLSQVKLSILDQSDSPISNVIVSIQEGEITYESNLEGKVTIQNINDGNNKPIKLSFYHLSYERLDTILEPATTPLFNIYLKEKNYVDSIFIIGEKKVSVIEKHTKSTITTAQLMRTPNILGSLDYTKTLQLLPGVSASYDFYSGLNVRGGSDAQNGVFLDNIPIINSNHILSLVPTISGEIIEKVDFHRGPFLSSNTGHLSSVTEIESKKLSHKKKASFRIGLLDSNLSFEKKLSKKISCFSNTRTFHLAPISLIQNWLYNKGALEDAFNLGFYDTFNKIKLETNHSGTISLNTYFSKDYIKQKLIDGDIKNTTNWSNTLLYLTQENTLRNKIFYRNSIAYIGYNRNQTNAEIAAGNETSIANKTKVKSIQFYTFWDWLGNHGDRKKFELRILHRNLRPLSNFENDVQTNIDENQVVTEIKPYFSWSKNIKRFKLQTDFNGLVAFDKNELLQRKIYPNIFLMYYISPSFELSMSFGQNYQSIFNLSSPLVGFGPQFIVQSRPSLPYQMSNISTLNMSFNKKDFSINSSIYYKTQRCLFEEQINSILLFETDYHQLLESLHTNGTLTSYGVDFSSNFILKNRNIYLAYSYSKAERSFPSIFEGVQYPFKFNRRHTISASLNRKLNQYWELTSLFSFTSGLNISLPAQKYPDISGNEVNLYTERNNYELPPYHRLDLSLIKTSKNRLNIYAFSIINLYNRKNISFLEDVKSEDIGGFNRYQKTTLLPFIASFSYTRNFQSK